MPMLAVKPSKIQMLLDSVRDATDNLLETVREAAKGDHPGLWPVFGSLIDIREVLGEQLKSIAEAEHRLEAAIGRKIGPAFWELLSIARNMYWFFTRLDVLALPAILDADLGDFKTVKFLAEKLSVDSDWSDIMIKLSTPICDPNRSDDKAVQEARYLQSQHKLAELAKEIDARLGDLAGRIEAELDVVENGFLPETKIVNEPNSVFRHDRTSFSIDCVNQFNVPFLIGKFLSVFAENPTSHSGRQLEGKTRNSNPSKAMKELCEWNNGILKGAVRMPGRSKTGYFINVIDVKKVANR